MHHKCVCGDKCKNSSIRRGHVCATEIMFAPEKGGFGIKTNQGIEKGTFIIEYIGEVIHKATYEDRLATIYAKDKHTYDMELSPEIVIDAHRMGNLSRFVNHSCNPNCTIERWFVDGLPRLALFARRRIKKDEEITFDYNLTLLNNAKNIICKCQSENCSGFIAKPAIRPQNAPHSKTVCSASKIRSPTNVGLKIDGQNDHLNSRYGGQYLESSSMKALKRKPAEKKV